MDPELVAKIAGLARMELSPGEQARLAGDLERILRHFEALADLNVEGIEPSPYAVTAENVFRDDIPREAPAPSVLAAAPVQERGFFRVPSIFREEARREAAPRGDG